MVLKNSNGFVVFWEKNGCTSVIKYLGMILGSEILIIIIIIITLQR